MQDDINVCEDQGYFKKKHLDDLRSQAEKLLKLINGYIAYLSRRLKTESEA